MLKNFKYKIKQNLEIFFLILLILITAISTNYYNHAKNKIDNTYNNFIDNIYFKKTLNHIVDNLEPKYRKIKHKIQSGETFDKILEKKEKISWINIKLFEGKNREIRKIMKYYGLFINDLIRIKFGPFYLNNLDSLNNSNTA